MFWSVFQLAVFGLFMWLFIDGPGEKNMSAAGIVSFLFAYMITLGLSNGVDLTNKLYARFKAWREQPAKPGFIRREPFL